MIRSAVMRRLVRLCLPIASTALDWQHRDCASTPGLINMLQCVSYGTLLYPHALISMGSSMSGGRAACSSVRLGGATLPFPTARPHHGSSCQFSRKHSSSQSRAIAISIRCRSSSHGERGGLYASGQIPASHDIGPKNWSLWIHAAAKASTNGF
jgi:hypothetical protein